MAPIWRAIAMASESSIVYRPRLQDVRCGIVAWQAGVAVRAFTLIPTLDRDWQQVMIHNGFQADRWLMTWSSSDADWYPAAPPSSAPPPAAVPTEDLGAATPLPTDRPGLYWYKGGCYGDFA